MVTHPEMPPSQEDGSAGDDLMGCAMHVGEFDDDDRLFLYRGLLEGNGLSDREKNESWNVLEALRLG